MKAAACNDVAMGLDRSRENCRRYAKRCRHPQSV